MITFGLNDTCSDYFNRAEHFNEYQRIRSKQANSVAYGAGAIGQYINHIFDDMINEGVRRAYLSPENT